MAKTKVKKPEKPTIPSGAAESIPYLNVFENGIIQISTNRFSKCYALPDINFKTAGDEEQYRLATLYGQFLGSFGDDVYTQIVLYNKTVNMDEFRNKVLLPMQGDNLNEYREEYNEMLIDKMKGAKNNLETEKYLCVEISALDVFEAEEKFSSLSAMINDNITTMTKTSPKELNINDRLEILNSIYNNDEHLLYRKRKIGDKIVESFTLQSLEKQGITTKDFISPPSFEFQSNYMKVGDRYAKSFYVAEYPTWVKGTVFTDFTSIPTNLLVSVHFHSLPQNDAIKMIKNQNTNISGSLLDQQKKAARSGYSAELISPTLTNAKNEATELLENITKDSEKLFDVTFVITIFADSKEELDRFEKQIYFTAEKSLITVRALNLQQEDGLNSCLPLGHNFLPIKPRLMTTSSIGSIIPFSVMDINHKNAAYYGLNAASGNMIMFNRGDPSNLNSCAAILGIPGGGKSFSAKREMINTLLNTQDKIYVIDPEGEYLVLAETFGGTIIDLGGGDKHINPLDLNMNNVDEQNADPVKTKIQFIENLCEIMIGGKYGLSPIEKSIIDRSAKTVYDNYLEYLKKEKKSQDYEHAPTLEDFYNDLSMQSNVESLNLALSLERYVKGAYDLFSHHTNLDLSNRFIVYNTKNLSAGLKELSLHICLDNIWNEMVSNKDKGVRTWFYIDEFYTLMQNQSSAEYTSMIWKRARKFGGYPCAITQNVEDMLSNEFARTVLNNSSFVMMLAQSPINKQELSKMMGLSAEEQKYIATNKPGMGLLRINNSAIIPMNDSFPTNTKLYKIMSTKPNEDLEEV